MTTTTQTADIGIIGGGIVGLATAYRLHQKYPSLRLTVLEKETEIATHQTGRNSGVIHSGLYYKPGSFRAKNCVEGRKQLIAFADEHGVDYELCGKVVVATDERELPHLERIFGNGQANGLQGLERIDAQQIKDHEPNCQGVAGLWVPETGIIHYATVAKALATAVTRSDSCQVLTEQEVVDIQHGAASVTVRTRSANFNFAHLISCTGLQSDRMAHLGGATPDVRIVGFRGDYYELTDEAAHKIKHLIYPVPDPAFPFLGVHFTRMITGGVECGPNAVFTFKREGYGKTDVNLADSFDALSYRGTWNLFRKHWRYGLNEYRRAFSKRRFLASLQRLVPSLTMADIRPGRAGVRALALEANGQMVDDFRIDHDDNAIYVLNAPSPAATANLAIGERIQQMATDTFGL